MTLDVFLLGLVLLFAVLGLFTGAARQIASLVATAAAYLGARPLGNAFGPQVALALHGPNVVGVIAATLVAFILVLITVRAVFTSVLRRMLRGKEQQRAGTDRLLGFVLGGAKVALIAYVMLSALSFVEDNVSVAGKRLGISPKDSVAFSLARHYNLFERTQFGPVKDLVRITQAMQDPAKAEQLRRDPAFQALLADSRFRAALTLSSQGGGLGHPEQTEDYTSLLRNNAILQLVQDPAAAHRLAEAADAVEATPGKSAPGAPGRSVGHSPHPPGP